MFAALQPQQADEILALRQIHADDPRPGKIDLGVGVYRDAAGRTPVMRAVRAAEQRLWEAEATKGYTDLAGEAAFRAAMTALILGAGVPGDRVAAIATPGGTGALRQGIELIRMAAPEATVWLSDPTWPNHRFILDHLGMRVASYRYFDAATRGVDFAGLMADLGQMKPGDAVLLHGCCHNPTGADLTAAEWADLAGLIAARGALPLVDLAYQGFGEGIERDAAPARLLAATCPEVLIAASCSKTFGLYRERAGILLALGDPAERAIVQDNLVGLNLRSYSFPPDHGARIVTTILDDPVLRADWMAELDGMRRSMTDLRAALADALRQLTGSDRWDFLAQHRGMFSRLGATPDEVQRLRVERGIYMVGDSRLNIAGLNPATVPVLARAIADLVA